MVFHFRRLSYLQRILRSRSAARVLRETKVIGLLATLQLVGGIGILVGTQSMLIFLNKEQGFQYLLPSLTGVILYLISLGFFRTGKYKLSGWFAVLSVGSVATLELVLTGEISRFSLYGFFALAFLAGMFMQTAQLVVLISILGVLGLGYHFRVAFLLPPPGSGLIQTSDLVIHALLLLLAVLIGRSLGRELDRALDQSLTLSQRFKAIFHQSTDAIFITDLNFRIIEANPIATELVNQSAETLLGKSLLEITPLAIENQISELASDTLTNGKISNIRLSVPNDSGAEMFLLVSANLVFHDGGRPDHIQVILRDITERKEVEDRIQQLALQDHLTKVDNRLSLTYRLNSLIAKMSRDGGGFALVYFDLDNFKTVNDTMGHTAGDLLIQSVVDVINENTRGTDAVSRLGGDEFAVLFTETRPEAAHKAVIKLQALLLEAMQTKNWPVTFSIGVVTCVELPESANHIISFADELMYSVKKSGKNRIACSQYQQPR